MMAILAIATFSFQSCGYSFTSDYEVEYGFLIDGEITLDNMNAAIVFYPELFEAMEKEFEALPHFTKTGPARWMQQQNPVSFNEAKRTVVAATERAIKNVPADKLPQLDYDFAVELHHGFTGEDSKTEIVYQKNWK